MFERYVEAVGCFIGDEMCGECELIGFPSRNGGSGDIESFSWIIGGRFSAPLLEPVFPRFNFNPLL